MIQIGGSKFEVPAPRGSKSFALQQRVIPVAGNLAAAVFGALAGAGRSIEDLAASVLEADVFKLLPAALPAVGEIFSRMPPGELDAITRELLEEATCEVAGRPIRLFGSQGGDAFDEVMRGRTVDTWKLLWHAVRVWYPDVFTLAAGWTGGGKKAEPSAA